MSSKKLSSRKRLWLFRLSAFGLGLSLFVLAEFVCIAFDWGRPTDAEDPFVGFSEVHPLFVKDEVQGRYEIAPSRRPFFAHDEFPIEKREKTFRVVCLGGSTVQGRPYSIPTSFTTWLELELAAGDPSRNWEVVNCGGISYASYRLVPILKEVLAYEPDLIILCTGHNEFLEHRSYGHIAESSRFWSAPQQAVHRLRTYHVLKQGVDELRGKEPVTERVEMKSEADAMLDYKNGLAAYHRDDDWHAGVMAHFRDNIFRMIALAEDAGVPLILIRPPSNLADSPPFKSEHRSDLTDAELSRWQNAVDAAYKKMRTDLPRAIALLEKAHQIDDRYAGTHFELAKCYAAMGDFESARREFVRARDEDICPLRMTSPLEKELLQAAEQTESPLIDAHELLEAEATNKILGGSILVDHVHPSFRGHQLIAHAIAREMQTHGWFRPQNDWRTTRDQAFAAHFESLDEVYFLKGQRMLDALEAWTRGEADGPPIESHSDPEIRKRLNAPATPRRPRARQD